MSDGHSTELWKEIPGFPGYEVSTKGRVRSYWRRRSSGTTLQFYIAKEPRFRKTRKDRNGYPRIMLPWPANPCGKRYMAVARLVLMTFVRMPEEGEMALHVDDPDKGNCRLSNLQWGKKPRNNGADIVRHQGKHPCSKLTPDDVRGIRKLLRTGGLLQREIGELFGVCRSTITLIARNKHHQYIA